MDGDWEPTTIREFSFVVYDVGSGKVETFDPKSDTTVISTKPDSSGQPQLHRGDAERGVQALYREQGYQVRDINHKYASPLRSALQIAEDKYIRSPEPWKGVKKKLCGLIKQHTSADSDQAALDQIDTTGIPDLLIRNETSQDQFFFVEVKQPREKLGADQRKWIQQFEFLPIKIAKIFPDQSARDNFVETTTLEDILTDVRDESSPRRQTCQPGKSPPN